MSRYQGLVALEGGDLEDAAHEYFLRSEQIPTRVRLAVGEELSAGRDGARHRWRAGGILLQFLPKAPERARQAGSRSGRCAGGHGAASGARGRCLGRGPLAVRDRRGRRADRSGGLGRAAGLSAVPRARRARLSQHAGDRAVLLLARRRRRHAQELLAGRSRPHGRERGHLGDLRVLQLELCVRAGRVSGGIRIAGASDADPAGPGLN